MIRAVLLLCYSGIAIVTIRWSTSIFDWVVFGVGLVSLAHRNIGRLALGMDRKGWARNLAVTTGTFLFGSGLALAIRPGVVPWSEAVYWGSFLCLVREIIERTTEVAASFLARLYSDSQTGSAYRNRWLVRIVLLMISAISMPYLVTIHPLHTVPKRTPASLGLAFEDVRLRTTDGILIAGWLVPVEQPRGNVLFCHGHGRNRGHSAALLTTLHDLGLNVLAIDFRGHGESGGHTCTFGQREIQDVLAAAVFLRERYPGKPLFLIGVSMGAATALQSLPFVPDANGIWSEGSFDQLDNVVNSQFEWLPRRARQALTSYYNWLAWLDCGFWGPDVSPIKSIKAVSNTPICFCHGSHDELVPFVEAQSLHDAYNGPRCNYWVPAATHYNVRQLNTNEYLHRLSTFLLERLDEIAAN